MAENVRLEVTGDSSKAQRDNVKLQVTIAELTQKLKNATQQSGKAEQAAVKWGKAGHEAAFKYDTGMKALLATMNKMDVQQTKALMQQKGLGAAWAKTYGDVPRWATAAGAAGVSAATVTGAAFVGAKGKIEGVSKTHRAFITDVSGGSREILRWAAGFGTAGVLLQRARAIFQGLQQEVEALGEKNKTQEQWDARFAQLAGGDSRKLADLIRQRKEFQMLGGVPAGETGSTEASKAIFAMESAGVNTPEIRKLMASLYPILEGNMGEVAANIGSAIKAMPREKLSFEQVLSKALVAQIPSPGTATEMLEAFKNVAPQADLLGISADETLAFIGSIAQAAGGAKVAADWINQYLKSFTKQGMTEGKSPAEQLKWLVDLDVDSPKYQELLQPDTVESLYAWADSAKVKKGRTSAGIEKQQILKNADVKEILQGIVARNDTTAEFEQDLTPELFNMLIEDIGQFGESFRGQPLAEIEARASRIFTLPAQRMKFFGERIQAMDAAHYFRQVQQLQLSPSGVEYSFPKMAADLGKATAQTTIRPMIAANALQPGLAAADMARKAGGKFDVEMEDLGALKQINKAAVQEFYGRVRKDRPAYAQVMKMALEGLEPYLRQEAILDIVGSEEQKTVAAGVSGAYAEANAGGGMKGGILDKKTQDEMYAQILKDEKKFNEYWDAARKSGQSGIKEVTEGAIVEAPVRDSEAIKVLKEIKERNAAGSSEVEGISDSLRNLSDIGDAILQATKKGLDAAVAEKNIQPEDKLSEAQLNVLAFNTLMPEQTATTPTAPTGVYPNAETERAEYFKKHGLDRKHKTAEELATARAKYQGDRHSARSRALAFDTLVPERTRMDWPGRDWAIKQHAESLFDVSRGNVMPEDVTTGKQFYLPGYKISGNQRPSVGAESLSQAFTSSQDRQGWGEAEGQGEPSDTLWQKLTQPTEIRRVSPELEKLLGANTPESQQFLGGIRDMIAMYTGTMPALIMMQNMADDLKELGFDPRDPLAKYKKREPVTSTEGPSAIALFIEESRKTRDAIVAAIKEKQERPIQIAMGGHTTATPSRAPQPILRDR
jgi:hypothetical protein